MYLRRVIFATSLAFLVAAGLSCQPAEGKSAQADIQGVEGSKLKGTVTFTEGDCGTMIVVELTGATKGLHGVHVHAPGDCSAADFKSSGGHFNPDEKKHGAPTAEERHAGDLGNIEVKGDGTGKLEWTDKILTVAEGKYSVVGKAIIVHDKPDDFGQPTGNAGARIGCGEIKAK